MQTVTFPELDRLPEGKTAAIIGGGPAGLIAAEVLARAGVAVTVYDQMPSLGRKFMMAGRGGLNLTHSEELSLFLVRYGDIDPPLRTAIEAFPPAALRAWADSMGAATFVGSSGRVFPETLKTSPLLRTWLLRLGNLGVKTKLRHRWDGFDADGNLRFAADACETANVTLLIETNNLVEHPGYYLARLEQAADIIAAVDHPRLRMLFDTFHVGLNEGNIVDNFNRHLALIDHVQIADVPGRHQPGEGDLDFDVILPAIDASGYDGWVGCEYFPLTDTRSSLAWMKDA